MIHDYERMLQEAQKGGQHEEDAKKFEKYQQTNYTMQQEQPNVEFKSQAKQSLQGQGRSSEAVKQFKPTEELKKAPVNVVIGDMKNRDIPTKNKYQEDTLKSEKISDKSKY